MAGRETTIPLHRGCVPKTVCRLPSTRYNKKSPLGAARLRLSCLSVADCWLLIAVAAAIHINSNPRYCGLLLPSLHVATEYWLLLLLLLAIAVAATGYWCCCYWLLLLPVTRCSVKNPDPASSYEYRGYTITWYYSYHTSCVRLIQLLMLIIHLVRSTANVRCLVYIRP